MKTLVLVLGLAATLAVSAAPASAGLITSLPGGQHQVMPAIDHQGVGPQMFGDGITWMSNDHESLFGWTDSYSFLDNGEWFGTPMAGTNGTEPLMSFSFANPVAAFLAEINWANIPEEDAFVRAYGAGDVLLEEVQLLDYGVDTREPGYLGFQFADDQIVRIELQGAYAGARNLSLLRDAAAVPEPAAWGLMIAGFGMAGVTLRRRRLILTAAA